MLEGKRILLVITGSIAAYKSLELIRLLTKAGASVDGVLTHAGSQFVTPLSVATLTGKPAQRDMWDERSHEMNHIELSRNCDLIVIAPASADFIAKLALGLGNDLATSLMLARNKPVILAPSMNVEMWENPAFTRNLEQTIADGATLIPPQNDILACGESGVGKMAEPATIFETVQKHLASSSELEGKTALVTTGATIEKIDSVRYISNFSSGKQGNAIALSLARSGAKVSLVAGETKSPIPQHPNIETIHVESAMEMNQAVTDRLPADVFVGCAAVSDFRVANQSARKIKKGEGLSLKFEENPDIARSVGTLGNGSRPSLVVGFAAETDDLLGNARKKLRSKSCDMIVANNVSGGAVFGKEDNQVHFVTESEIVDLEPMSKEAVANRINRWIRSHL